MSDLTLIYYTANVAPVPFAQAVRRQLVVASEGLPIISVSQRPLYFGQNIVFHGERSHFNIYRQALIGAKEAKTKYIALCEDDVLYSPEHFKRRPSPGKFAYNLAAWSMYTWVEPPMFTHKGKVRKNLYSLICERDLFIEAMEERFSRYPNDEAVKEHWAEPGKYEKFLGVTIRDTEEFYTNPPNVVFSHESALQFEGLGKRKRTGEFKAFRIPYWGEAKDVLKIYKGE